MARSSIGPRLLNLPLEQHPPIPVVQRDPDDLPLGKAPVDPDLPGDLLGQESVLGVLLGSFRKDGQSLAVQGTMSTVTQMPWTLRVLFGLLATVAVAFVVMAVTTPRVFRTGPSAESLAQMGMQIVVDVLDDYHRRHGELPHDLGSLTRPGSNLDEPWFDVVPTDPWGVPFVYRVEGEHEYTLHSSGADGQDGTEDDVWYAPPSPD